MSFMSSGYIHTVLVHGQVHSLKAVCVQGELFACMVGVW